MDNDIETWYHTISSTRPICHPIPRSQLRLNQDYRTHLKSSLQISILWWPILLNRYQLLYRLAHHCSHGEECQRSSLGHGFEGTIHQNSSTGLMEDHSLPPEHSKTLQYNGSSSIKRPPPLSPEQWKGRSNCQVDEWNGRFLDGDKLCKALLQYNTSLSCDGLPLAMATQCRIHWLPTWSDLIHNQPNLKEAAKKTERTQKTVFQYYNRAAHPQLEFYLGTQVALQNLQTKLWDWYGEVIRVGQHC